MYWPMCSALIDDENRCPSRSTASTSVYRVTEYIGRSVKPVGPLWLRNTGHSRRASAQIG